MSIVITLIPVSAVFVPNNDISPARRMRINKALEFGAAWAKSWNDQITHVIVDRELCFEDVMNYLKLKSLPVSLLQMALE